MSCTSVSIAPPSYLPRATAVVAMKSLSLSGFEYVK